MKPLMRGGLGRINPLMWGGLGMPWRIGWFRAIVLPTPILLVSGAVEANPCKESWISVDHGQQKSSFFCIDLPPLRR